MNGDDESDIHFVIVQGLLLW